MINPGLIALQERRDRLAMLGHAAGEWGALMHPDADEFLTAVLDYWETHDEQEAQRLTDWLRSSSILHEALQALRNHIYRNPVPTARQTTVDGA